MKSISLYVDKDTYLTRMHPFTKLCYIITAIAASLISGKLTVFGVFIGISLVMLLSGKIIRKVFPLIAFSFTILITIFLIHGLFNHENATLLLAILHDMDFVAENFERVIVMAHGQVLADGTREEVFAQEEVLKKARIEQPYMTRLCSLLGYEKLYFGGI